MNQREINDLATVAAVKKLRKKAYISNSSGGYNPASFTITSSLSKVGRKVLLNAYLLNNNKSLLSISTEVDNSFNFPRIIQSNNYKYVSDTFDTFFSSSVRRDIIYSLDDHSFISSGGFTIPSYEYFDYKYNYSSEADSITMSALEMPIQIFNYQNRLDSKYESFSSSLAASHLYNEMVDINIDLNNVSTSGDSLVFDGILEGHWSIIDSYGFKIRIRFNGYYVNGDDFEIYFNDSVAWADTGLSRCILESIKDIIDADVSALKRGVVDTYNVDNNNDSIEVKIPTYPNFDNFISKSPFCTYPKHSNALISLSNISPYKLPPSNITPPDFNSPASAWPLGMKPPQYMRESNQLHSYWIESLLELEQKGIKDIQYKSAIDNFHRFMRDKYGVQDIKPYLEGGKSNYYEDGFKLPKSVKDIIIPHVEYFSGYMDLLKNIKNRWISLGIGNVIEVVDIIEELSIEDILDNLNISTVGYKGRDTEIKRIEDVIDVLGEMVFHLVKIKDILYNSMIRKGNILKVIDRYIKNIRTLKTIIRKETNTSSDFVSLSSSQVSRLTVGSEIYFRSSDSSFIKGKIKRIEERDNGVYFSLSTLRGVTDVTYPSEKVYATPFGRSIVEFTDKDKIDEREYLESKLRVLLYENKIDKSDFNRIVKDDLEGMRNFISKY